MDKSNKITGIYMRVSTAQQSTASQKPDLQRWIDAQNPDDLGRVLWYRDKSTGTNTDRPGWQKLQRAIDRGEVQRVVCWRLDRLGRSASDLCRLFDQLKARKINLISLKESIDLKSAGGRLLANIMASVAAFETELRAERVKAGQAAARAKGVRWGGSEKGRLHSITPEQVRQVKKMKDAGERITDIAKACGIRSRKSIYRILSYIADGTLKING